MAQLFFRYGAMNSSKSASLLMVKHNYEENGKNVLLLTSALDNRDGVGRVSSRVGISSDAVALSEYSNIFHALYTRPNINNVNYDCVLVDECQFLTSQQVKQLSDVVDEKNIPVICYGLKNDFQNNLFEGSKALLTYADKIEEIKTLCTYCKRKAIMNLRLNNGKPVYDGEQVQIGGNESYKPVCRKHYRNPYGSSDK